MDESALEHHQAGYAEQVSRLARPGWVVACDLVDDAVGLQASGACSALNDATVVVSKVVA